VVENVPVAVCGGVVELVDDDDVEAIGRERGEPGGVQALDRGEDVLEPYKATIDRWVCPDVMRNQDISVAKAKKAISDYKKAIGRPEGLVELTVFYCESCMNLLGYCGMDDEGYFNTLVRMFEQALKAITALEPSQQEDFVERLERVRSEGHNWGWGVGDDMDDLMAEYGFAEE